MRVGLDRRYFIKLQNNKIILISHLKQEKCFSFLLVTNLILGDLIFLRLNNLVTNVGWCLRVP